MVSGASNWLGPCLQYSPKPVFQAGFSLFAKLTFVASPGVQALLRSAEAAFRAGDFAQTESLCRQALSQEPQTVHAMHLLRILAHRNGNESGSLDLLNAILSIDPNHVESLNGKANILRLRGSILESIELCNRALAIRPDYVNALNTLGLARLAQGKDSLALECFQRALEIKPNFPAGYLNQGAALAKLGRRSEAAASYRRAATLAPDTSEANEALGHLLMQERKREEALECFRTEMRRNPDSAKAYLLASDCLLQQGASAEAAECATSALALNPSIQAHNALGFALQDLGRFDEAIAEFRASLEQQPQQSDAYLGLATSGKLRRRMAWLNKSNQSLQALCFPFQTKFDYTKFSVRLMTISQNSRRRCIMPIPETRWRSKTRMKIQRSSNTWSAGTWMGSFRHLR
jgi:Tfp pilus assembly protein PilF